MGGVHHYIVQKNVCQIAAAVTLSKHQNLEPIVVRVDWQPRNILQFLSADFSSPISSSI